MYSGTENCKGRQNIVGKERSKRGPNFQRGSRRTTRLLANRGNGIGKKAKRLGGDIKMFILGARSRSGLSQREKKRVVPLAPADLEGEPLSSGIKRTNAFILNSFW